MGKELVFDTSDGLVNRENVVLLFELQSQFHFHLLEGYNIPLNMKLLQNDVFILTSYSWECK